MTQAQSLCVYCGASNHVEPIYLDAARTLGQQMAERGIRLVFGGGQVGLMGAVADSVLEGGGEAIGVFPDHLHRFEAAHRGVTRMIAVEDMHQRKRTMFDLADAIAILPGGIGTLDETFEMVTWKQLEMHDKPIVLVNIADYWTPLLDLIDHMIAHRFAREGTRELFTVVNSVDKVFDAIAAAPPPRLPAHANWG